MSELFTFAPGVLERMQAEAKLRERFKIRGHAGQPGAGPAGETCKSCEHYTHKTMGNTYRKCALRSATWTGGPGTDIRAGDPACPKWARRT